MSVIAKCAILFWLPFKAQWVSLLNVPFCFGLPLRHSVTAKCAILFWFPFKAQCAILFSLPFKPQWVFLLNVPFWFPFNSLRHSESLLNVQFWFGFNLWHLSVSAKCAILFWFPLKAQWVSLLNVPLCFYSVLSLKAQWVSLLNVPFCFHSPLRHSESRCKMCHFVCSPDGPVLWNLGICRPTLLLVVLPNKLVLLFALYCFKGSTQH